MAQAKPKKNGAVAKKLVGMADVVISAAQRAKDPTFEIPIRALSNVSFNPRKGLIEMGEKKQSRTFFNVGMAKKFMQTMLVADALAELQQADLTTSLREIYYRTKHTIQDSNENTFDMQDESDPIIEDLKCRSSPCEKNSMCGRKTAAASSGRWSSAMTATGWIAPSWAKADIPCPRSSSRNIWRSAAARPIFCCW